MFKTVLVPIDILQPSSWEHAIPEAIELAAASNGSVTVATGVRDLKAAFEGTQFPFQIELMVSKARVRLGQIASEYRDRNVVLNADVRFGSIGRQILEAAREQKADLIVMASHRPELKDTLIGPNAAYVAQHATCSVLVLRSPAQNSRG